MMKIMCFRKGQALIAVIVLSAIAITLMVSSMSIANVQTQLSLFRKQSLHALYAAESGVQEGILRILRNPTLTIFPAYVLSPGEQWCEEKAEWCKIEITGATTKTILTQVKISGKIKKARVIGSFSGGGFSIDSWEHLN